MEIISPTHIIQELQRLTAEMDKGSNALYDAECKGFGFYNKDGELYNRDEMRKFFDGEWA